MKRQIRVVLYLFQESSITRVTYILLTLGSEGLFVHDRSGVKEWDDDALTALNRSPLDVARAGDGLLVGASLAITVGANIWEAAYIGSMVAACQVSCLGNVPVSIDDLLREV